MRLAGPVATLVALALLPGCGAAAQGTPPGPPVRLAAVPGERVAVLVMENHELPDVVGSPDAPYLTGLARRYALATDYRGVAHPSLPNYLALVTGSTHGISSDCAAADCPVSGPSLVDQLERRRLSWRAYMEGLPRAGFLGATAGRYAQKHDPFAYLTRVRSSRARRARIVPLSRLAGAERGGLPRFSFIAPDLCHDMHDCSVATGDAWLRAHVPPLLRALGPRGLLLLTFDEGTSDTGGGGRVATIAAGGLARRSVRSGRTTDHYGLLATVEDLLGLPRLAHARGAVALRGLLRRPGR